MILIITVAITSGITNVISRNINSILADRIGLINGTFFNYVTGLLISAIFLILSGGFNNLSFIHSKFIPFWAYLGGLIGVIVVALSSMVAAKISAFYLTLIMFIWQLFAGILIDYFTLGLLSTGKILGGLLVVSGLTCNLIIDKKVETNMW